MSERDYFRGCCYFDDFLNAFMKAARRKNFPVLIAYRLQARRDWRKGMTGGEALRSQIQRECKENGDIL